MDLQPSSVAEQTLVDYLTGIRSLRQQMCREQPTSSANQFKYVGFEDYLLQHGTFFTPRELPRTVRPMAISCCYENAFRVASRTKALHYVEGIAIAVMPVPHAWLVDKDGCVVDPTWAAPGFGTAYIGVELNMDEVKKSRRVGLLSLSDDYRRKWPLLRGEENVIAPNAWFVR